MQTDIDAYRETIHRLLDREDRLRRDFARFLHDEIAQSLAIFRMELPAISECGTDAGKSVWLKELIDCTLVKTRDAAMDAHPSLLDDLGLIPAIGWLLRRIDPEQKIVLNVEPRILDLNAELNRTCYRIAEIALRRITAIGIGDGASIRLRIGRNPGNFTMNFTSSNGAFSESWRDSPESREIILRADRLNGTIAWAADDSRIGNLEVVFPLFE